MLLELYLVWFVVILIFLYWFYCGVSRVRARVFEENELRKAGYDDEDF